MGYPLSSFQQLAELCRRDSYGSTFDRYKLVSVLVFGPNDREVKDALKFNFERLHQTTGPDFAFIAFLNPPERWKQEHAQWMRVTKELMAGLSTNEDRIIAALRSRFGLPHGPSILLTDDLRSNRFAVIPTDARHLVGQMEDIGQYASNHEGRFPINDPDFAHLLARYESVFVEETENRESIAKNIADILAVDSLFYSSEDYPESNRSVREEAGEWVSRTLQELLDKAHHYYGEQSEQFLKLYSDYLALSIGTVDSEKDSEKDSSRAETDPWSRWAIDHLDEEQRSPRLSSRIYEEEKRRIEREEESPCRHNPDSSSDGGYCGFTERESCNLSEHAIEVHPSAFRPRKVDIQRYLIPEQFVPWLTDYSRHIRENFNSILPFIFQSMDYGASGYPSYISRSRPDFSPLGLYMGLIMEEEMNASVVQLSRKNAGIRMPEFYRLWDKGNASLPPVELLNGGTVFLNGRGKRKGKDTYRSRSIPIGQAVYVVRSMLQTNPRLPFGYFGEEPFLSRMDSFARYRNQADHAGGIFEKRDFLRAHQVFSSICELDLHQMAALKESLRKHPSRTAFNREDLF